MHRVQSFKKLVCPSSRDDVDKFIESSFNPGQNLSNKEKGALKELITEKNKVIYIDDTDKNLGVATY